MFLSAVFNTDLSGNAVLWPSNPLKSFLGVGRSVYDAFPFAPAQFFP